MKRRQGLAFAAACAGLVVASLREGGGVVPAPGAPLPARCAGPRTLEASLFLIGDAGAPRPAGEPTLGALAGLGAERAARVAPGHAAVAFLGDDVYPAGLPAPDDAGRPEAERRLGAQLEAARAGGLRAFVVPGNHDWDNGGGDGWNAVRRAQAFVETRGDAAEVVPPDGCPGPAAARLGAHLALLFLDTQWWLHGGPKPEPPDSGCAADTREQVVDALAAALRGAGDRHAIVMAHHPLVTGGPHAARFDWREHIFPLRTLARPLWLPLPGVGSAWWIARALGASPQDLSSPRYRRLRADLERALAAAPPLVYAAGHDHGLQVMRGGPARFLLVSGAGSSAILTRVAAVSGSLYARSTPGFAVLDAFADGAVELALYEAPETGPPEPVYAACLSEAAASPIAAAAASARPIRNERGR